MPAVRIPKSVTRGEELVVVLKKDYEALVKWQNRFKQARTDDPDALTPVEIRQLAQARRDVARGEYYLWEDIKNELDLDHRATSAKKS